MGICSSCLNRDFDGDFSDEDEESRLLYDDPHANDYGSFGGQNPRSLYADPEEARRANEALMKVVTKTSEHLVDIFSMAPQNFTPPNTTPYPGHDIRPQYYNSIMAKISLKNSGGVSNRACANLSSCQDDEWIIREETLEKINSHPTIKSEGIGPFLGGFTDPASAME